MGGRAPLEESIMHECGGTYFIPMIRRPGLNSLTCVFSHAVSQFDFFGGVAGSGEVEVEEVGANCSLFRVSLSGF